MWAIRPLWPKRARSSRTSTNDTGGCSYLVSLTGVVSAASAQEGTPRPPIIDVHLFQDGSFGMMGEIGAQYAGMSLSDPRFEPYLALAEELDVPLGIHTGISFAGISFNPCCRNFRTVYGNP